MSRAEVIICSSKGTNRFADERSFTSTHPRSRFEPLKDLNHLRSIRFVETRVRCVCLSLLCGLASHCGQPPAADSPQSSEPEHPPLFTEITSRAGLSFKHNAEYGESFFMPQIMGSGGAVFDHDGDGGLDIYLVNSGHPETTKNVSSLSNRLFSRDAQGRYRDRTADSGLGDVGYGMGCAVGDIDNDGDPDLLVTNFGPDTLYRNNGDGTFSDVTARAGIAGSSWSMSAAFLDYDRDGWLDLYITHYVLYEEPKSCLDAAGRPEYCGPKTFFGVADSLYHNQGDGTFEDVSVPSGIAGRSGRGLGVLVYDFDQDGWPDIYVANDGEENNLWINLQDGRFEDQALIRGTALNLFGKPEASMGVAAGDVDGDGDFDLFMTHLNRESNTLYYNIGEGEFEDGSTRSGLAEPSLSQTGFGTGFLDYDHDADLDLFVANGKVRRGASRGEIEVAGGSLSLLAYAEPNQLFENQGGGRFLDASPAGGNLTGQIEVSRGVMVTDLDKDGDLDLLLTNTNGPARLFSNEAPKRGRWLQIRALDPSLGRDAIGATVIVRQETHSQTRYVTRTLSYLSSTPPIAHFGLSGPQKVRVTVIWPDGMQEDFDETQVDQSVVLRKGSGVRRPAGT